MTDSTYVWYASYGSNLSRDRFMCYIEGGVPKGSSQAEKGCRDQTAPIDDQPISLPYPLYFAKQSIRWGGGVAFIGSQPVENEVAWGRMYLITKEQFTDVMSQENKNLPITIDFNKVEEEGSQVVTHSFYGRIVYVGDRSHYPIFTFTSVADYEPTQPSEPYLQMIISGLKEINQASDQAIIRYLLQKPGVAGNYSAAHIQQMVNRR